MTTVKDELASNQRWVIDSGASHHILTPSGVQMRNCRAVPEGKTVTLADGSRKLLQTAGTVFVNCLQTDLEAFVLPGMKCCLLSVSSLVGDGFKVCFENNMCSISKKGKLLVSIACQDGLYVLDGTDRQE